MECNGKVIVVRGQVILIGILCFYLRSSVEFNKTLHFSIILYISLHRKCFFFNILESVLAYDLVKIGFKEKEVILNGNTNDKSRGIQ